MYVCIVVCVHKFYGVIDHCNGNNDPCIDFRRLNVWNGCGLGPRRAVCSTFVSLCVRARLWRCY